MPWQIFRHLRVGGRAQGGGVRRGGRGRGRRDRGPALGFDCRLRGGREARLEVPC